MNTQIEKIDYFSGDFNSVEKELKEIFASDTVNVEIDAGLEEALAEMQSIKDRLSEKESGKLLELCKDTVIETITGQFGLASLFIQTMDGGNVTTAHNFEKGIVSSDSDRRKYDEYVKMRDNVVVGQNKNGKNIRAYEQKRKDVYNPVHEEKRGVYIPKSGEVIDAYTGKKIPSDKANLDHIVPIKEIETNAKAHLAMPDTERAKLACSDRNYAVTSESANKSKGPKKMDDFLNSDKAAELEIDPKLAKKEDSDARKHVYGTIDAAQAKKYTKELLASGGKDAAMMAAYTGLGIILREFTQVIFVEIHTTFRNRGKESFSDIFRRFKDSAGAKFKEIKGKWKDIIGNSFESGVTAFLSNLLVFVINLFATTLKKIVSMIRAGFVSLLQAIKIMAKPPAGMPREEVNYQALKILTAGLIGAASLGLSAAIEKLLQMIPGLQPLMMFPVPFMHSRTVSDIVAVVLSALVGGLLTTVVLYFMDKCRENSKKEKLQIQLMAQSGVVAQYKIAQTWVCLDQAYRHLQSETADTVNYMSRGYAAALESAEKAEDAVAELSGANQRLQSVLEKLK